MNTIEKKSLQFGKWVDRKHVDEVVRNYKQERWVHNSERIGKADSLSAWYSIEKLEEYIDVIKQHGADGIRIYFAAYPEVFDYNPDFAGRQTLVLVATKNTTGDGDTRANKDLYIGSGSNAEILAYNYPGICPPLCTGPSPATPPPTGAKPEVGVTMIDRGEKGITVI